MDRCASCRFVYEELALPDALDTTRGMPAEYRDRLVPAEAAGLARIRPEPSTWSALEYTCHVRDVLQVQTERIELALVRDRPTFEPMGRDELVTLHAYNEQDVEVVLREVGEAAATFVATAAALDEPAWQRTGIYTWPTESERTLAWLVRHTVHEQIHHLDDVERVLARVREQA